MSGGSERACEDKPTAQMRERAAIQKSLDSGHSLAQFDPECDMVEVFDEIAVEIERLADQQTTDEEATA